MLFVVFNNGVWGVVDRATRAMYPKGYATRANAMPLTRLDIDKRGKTTKQGDLASHMIIVQSDAQKT